MSISSLGFLVRRSGIVGFLDHIGLGTSLRSLLTSQGRIIAADYHACREQIARIVAGAPQSDLTQRAWLIDSANTVADYKFTGVLSLALRIAGYQPVVVGFPNWLQTKYHPLFGLVETVDFKARIASEPAVPLPSEYADVNHSDFGIRDLMGLEYRNVAVGRIALSYVLSKRKFERFDLSHPEVREDIFNSLTHSVRLIHAAEHLITEQPPCIALVCEKGSTPWAELVGACWTRGIPVIQHSGAPKTTEFVLRRFTIDNRFQHPFSLDNLTWQHVKKMPWSAVHSEAVIGELTEAYVAGTWFNRKFLHHDKSIKSPEEVRTQLGLDPAKKTAVIFSHVLWDATFFFGEGLFDTYEEWLLATVRAACANPAVNWLVKLHPDLVWKLKYEGYTGELRDVLAVRSAVGTLPEHVKLVMPDTDISTYSFFSITDYCLTVRGTIGIEMACHGVPVLTAGTGRYSNLGFTIDSSTTKEYMERLSCIQEVPPMSQDQAELARRFAYAVFQLRPWRLRSFEFVKKPLQQLGHPLDNNLIPQVGTWEEFAQAEDIRRFVQWVQSEEPDFMNPIG